MEQPLIPITSEQSFSAFKEGLGSVFRQWTALELAVDQQWGGVNSSEKADQLINSILSMFSSSKKVYKDEIVVFLEDYLEIEFSIICEDDSPSEIAELLLDMWRQCSIGNFALATNALAREYARHEVLHQSQGMDMESDDEEEGEGSGAKGGGTTDTIMEEDEDVEDPSPAPPRVDADGWETVARGKSSRKKR